MLFKALATTATAAAARARAAQSVIAPATVLHRSMSTEEYSSEEKKVIASLLENSSEATQNLLCMLFINVIIINSKRVLELI